MTSGVQLVQGITAGAVWAEELEQLAARAEKLEHREEPASLPELVALAEEGFRYLFLAMSPAVIARSCRLSARLHVPVLAVPQLDQQVDLTHQVRWRVHDQTADVPAPAEPAPAPCPPGLQELADVPAPAPAPVAERQLRPAAERMAARPAAPPRPEPERVEAPPLPAHLIPPAPEPKPAPLPRPVSVRRYPAASKPPGWFSGQEVQELFDVCTSTVCKWRNLGRLGEQGTGWQRCGKSYYYNPLAVEQLEAGNIPAGLDDLLAEVQGQ